jgi:hypothetical protein
VESHIQEGLTVGRFECIANREDNGGHDYENKEDEDDRNVIRNRADESSDLDGITLNWEDRFISTAAKQTLLDTPTRLDNAGSPSRDIPLPYMRAKAIPQEQKPPIPDVWIDGKAVIVPVTSLPLRCHWNCLVLPYS